MHYYKRNIGDYSKKAGRLSMLQHGSYTLLIDSCYDREKFPTLEEAIEWTWASSKEEREAVEFVLKKFFTLQEDGRFVQSRIEEEINYYHEMAATNKRIAEEREAKRKGLKTDGERVVNESPPNQEPRTKNQEPIKEPLSSKPDLIAVLQHLNEKANRDFQPVPANLKLIEARLKEGATLEKCKQVIDVKVAEWVKDKKMSEYLRPATLFNSTNFAQYVGQLPKDAQVKREWQEGDRNGDLIYEKFIGWRKLNRIELLAEQKAKEAAGQNNAGN